MRFGIEGAKLGARRLAVNSKERAEKIAERMWGVRYINPRSVGEVKEMIVAQIDEAVREAIVSIEGNTACCNGLEHNHESHWLDDLKATAYTEGFRAAQQNAAEIAKEFANETSNAFLLDCAGRIRQMKP